MKMLNMVADPANSSKNMMTTNNICIVFAPILLTKKNASAFDTSDFKPVGSVITGLINEYKVIFEVRTMITLSSW